MTKNTVPIQIGSRNTSALVDSGASVSIINRDFLGKTSYANDELLPPEFTSVKGASGRLLPVIGKLNAEIFINGQSYPFMVHVVDCLHHAFILGVDFLCAYDTVLRFSKENTMLIPDAQGEINVCVISTENGYARAKCAITIPQRCEMNVPVHISRHNNGDVVLLEPHKDLEALQLCAARCYVQVNSSQAFIRLINPTFEQVQIPMNFIVANVVEINQGEIVSLEGGVNTINALHPDISKSQTNRNLHFDLENSDLDHNQKEVLLKFLANHRDNFATDLSELGMTSAHKHQIEIKPNSKPVRLNFYRTSPQASKEIENQDSEMLKHNIIQPSNSEWYSPVVLV